MLVQSIISYLPHLWQNLALPLLRILTYLTVGLLLANLIEAFNWSRHMARLASPLVRFGRLGDVAGASFSLAFFSAQASNALLAEGVEQKRISRRELILSNLFNSSPTFLVHLPTLFSLAFSLLGTAAFIYVGLTFAAALSRSLTVVLFGRLFLPLPAPEKTITGNGQISGPSESGESGALSETDSNSPYAPGIPDTPGAPHAPGPPYTSGAPARKSLGEALQVSLKRFKRRIRKLLVFTVPIYVALFVVQELGWFNIAELWMEEHLAGLSFIRPETLGIVILNLAAESGAAMTAAGVLLRNDSLPTREIILALLAGNILSSPMRALRHQFPAYAGYFAPKLALELVLASQTLRAVSLIAVAALYGMLS